MLASHPTPCHQRKACLCLRTACPSCAGNICGCTARKANDRTNDQRSVVCWHSAGVGDGRVRQDRGLGDESREGTATLRLWRLSLVLELQVAAQVASAPFWYGLCFGRFCFGDFNMYGPRFQREEVPVHGGQTGGTRRLGDWATSPLRARPSLALPVVLSPALRVV